MSDYPYRHSTYYTRNDELISELPPMNTQEDLLQERVALRQSRLETYHPVYWADDGPRRTLSLVLLHLKERISKGLRKLKLKLRRR
ncbi:hypothetical protein AB1N83_004529 [Pleurotus pulmonarius]|nr:hypothetical protein EYR38_003525 [Pleurotus pulmonarius]